MPPLCRPFSHRSPPASSLVSPSSSRDSAQFLTYPAHYLTFRPVSLGFNVQIRPLNLNLES